MGKSLVVLPHYSIWDPSDKPQGPSGIAEGDDPQYKYPWMSHNERLSREGWLKRYVQAAPQVQEVLDGIMKPMQDYYPDVDTGACTSVKKLGCLAGIAGKLAQARAVRAACGSLQETEMSIRQSGIATSFPSATPKGKVVDCVMGSSQCARLNCYKNDQRTKGAVRCLEERLRECKPEVKAEFLSMKKEPADCSDLAEESIDDDEVDAQEEIGKEELEMAAQAKDRGEHGAGEDLPWSECREWEPAYGRSTACTAWWRDECSTAGGCTCQLRRSSQVRLSLRDCFQIGCARNVHTAAAGR